MTLASFLTDRMRALGWDSATPARLHAALRERHPGLHYNTVWFWFSESRRPGSDYIRSVVEVLALDEGDAATLYRLIAIGDAGGGEGEGATGSAA